jgi:hypothetical protein
MSKLITTKEQRIRESIDRIFGNSVAAQELKSIALKSALGELNDEVMKEYWETKNKDLEEIKQQMPDVNDLALPYDCKVIVGEPLLSNTILGEPESNNYEINGTVDVSRQREDGGNQNNSIKHEVISGNITERGQKVVCDI